MLVVMLINSLVPVRQIKHFPLGLAQIASVLSEEGYQVGIIDANLYPYSLEEIKDDIKNEHEEYGLEMVGFGGIVTTYSFQKETIKLVRSALNELELDIPIVSGGGCASSIPKEMLTWIPELNICVVGEGEETILELMKNLKHGKIENINKIKGIAYRNTKGKIINKKSKSRPLIKNLDDLPYPAYDLFGLDNHPQAGRGYFSYSSVALSGSAIMSKRRLDMIATRGCIYSCRFCWNTFGHSKIRSHTPRYVVDHIKFLRIRYAVDFISFVDELFTADKKWINEFCDLLDQEDLVGAIKWGFAAHVNTVDGSLLARMKSAGATYVDYGFESVDDRVLKYVKKGSTAKQNQDALNMTLQAKLNPITNFMVGSPNEDAESILRMVQFWKQNGIMGVPFFMTPYPDGELYREYKDQIIKEYGSLEAFMMSLSDATQFTINLTQWDDPTLIGLRYLVTSHDIERIEKWANETKQKGEWKSFLREIKFKKNFDEVPKNLDLTQKNKLVI